MNFNMLKYLYATHYSYLVPPEAMVAAEQTVNVVQNNSILMNCSMKANPEPTFEWFKDEYVQNIEYILITFSTIQPNLEFITASSYPVQLNMFSRFKANLFLMVESINVSQQMPYQTIQFGLT